MRVETLEVDTSVIETAFNKKDRESHSYHKLTEQNKFN